METQCSRQKWLFEAHARREVLAAFDGGKITSDGGGLLLREVEQRFGIVRSFVTAFTDHRSEDASELTVTELLRLWAMGIAPGYEALNDHEQLRHDPLLALMAGRRDITRQDRAHERSKGVPLAGTSTLNRLELTPAGAGGHGRYKKIVASVAKLQDTLGDTFIRMRSKQGVPRELVLDPDATDDPIRGDQSFERTRRRPHAVRRPVLRTRGDGKPHQGYNNCICSPIARVLMRCVPTSCVCCFRRWRICCILRCGNSVLAIRSCRMLRPARFVPGC